VKYGDSRDDVIIGSILFALALLWSGDRSHKAPPPKDPQHCEETKDSC